MKLNTDEISLLFAMLRNQVNGQALPFATLSTEQLAAVRSLAAHHQLSHLVGACVIAHGLIDDPQLLADCRRDKISIGLQLQAQEAEAQRICAALSQHNIPYIRLKGQVIRSYYPQPWMRNSRDVDILIPKQFSKDICQTLCQQFGYSILSDGGHDITLRARNGLWMEMHYQLMQDGSIPRLETIWDRAEPTGVGTEHRMCNADFFLYYLAHMAKHFRNGGCGIRPVMDLWLFMKRGYRGPMLDELLRQHGLLQFTEMMEQLCKVWFGGERHNESTRRIESFLLRGGVHGDEQFYHVTTLQKNKGKSRYLLSRVFPPFDALRQQYPRLQRQPWLAPFMAIHRLFRILFGKERNSYQTQMQHIMDISKAARKEANAIWKDVGF